jgi:hypothetical protein
MDENIFDIKFLLEGVAHDVQAADAVRPRATDVPYSDP